MASVESPEGEWEPIRPEQLQVGHYIKISHRWFDHPFVKRIFPIESESEIAIIRDAGLINLFVDYSRSKTVASTPTVATASASNAADERVVRQMSIDKMAQYAKVVSLQEQMRAVAARYRASIQQTIAMHRKLSEASSDGGAEIVQHARSVVNNLINGAPSLTYVQLPKPHITPERSVFMCHDACGLVGLLGKRMGVAPSGLRSLIEAAAMHLVGLQHIPAHLAEDSNSSAFRSYPRLSAEAADKCGHFSADTLRILHEHCEMPDGSGFPLGLTARDIHPLALLLGVVRAFQVSCLLSDASPSAALGHLYRTRSEGYGDELISGLVTSVTAYPPGTCVLMSDGSLGVVQATNHTARMRPIIALIDDDSGDILASETIDLAMDHSLSVARAVPLAKMPKPYIEKIRDGWNGMAIMEFKAGGMANPKAN